MDTREIRLLPRLWRRWLAVVSLFQRRAPGRVRLVPEEYQALQQSLLQLCEQLDKEVPPDLQPRLKHLEQLVRPWLNASALEQADRELLADLVARCHRAAAGWLEPEPRRGWLPWLLVVFLIAAGAVFVVSAWTGWR
jgi:hypothetical protein